MELGQIDNQLETSLLLQGEVHPRERAIDMREFDLDATDQFPHDMPEELGDGVHISCFLNTTPIIWYSKRQNNSESSTFGSELIALKQAVDMIEGLLYKLRMFGIAILGEARIFCDNKQQ